MAPEFGETLGSRGPAADEHGRWRAVRVGRVWAWTTTRDAVALGAGTRPPAAGRRGVPLGGSNDRAIAQACRDVPNSSRRFVPEIGWRLAFWPTLLPARHSRGKEARRIATQTRRDCRTLCPRFDGDAWP